MKKITAPLVGYRGWSVREGRLESVANLGWYGIWGRSVAEAYCCNTVGMAPANAPHEAAVGGVRGEGRRGGHRASALASRVLGSTAGVGGCTARRGRGSAPEGGAGVRQVEVDRDRFQAVMQLLADHPELDADRLRTLAEPAPGRRRRPDPVRPRSWSEITAAVEAGWVPKEEARQGGGLAPPAGAPRAAP